VSNVQGSLEVSAVAGETTRRTVSRQMCCKQMWTLNVIKLRQN